MVEVDVVENFAKGDFEASFGLAFGDQQAIIEEKKFRILIRF